jgi:hypothetical protein
MNPPATMDPKRLGAIVNVFSGAFIETPEDADLVDRTRMALKTLPDKTVRELDEAIRTLALLTKERLADGRTEKQEETR